MSYDDLDDLREEVDQLSLEILDLLNRRARCVLEIGRSKRRLGLPPRDARREARLLARLADGNDGPFPDDAVRALFERIFDESLGLMEGQKGPTLRVSAGSGSRTPITVRGRTIGGDRPVYIAGPCSIESEEQLDAVAGGLARLGVGFLRGGAFKPRTSPYTFQGLGEPALELLREAGERHDLVTVTEVISPELAPVVARYADVLQIGARNMYNYELLRAAGRTGKPVLLKRSFSATLDEWLMAAEYVALAGSEQIVLCERGVRTFARETRNTLDVSIVPLALERSRLPVIVDVAHAAGRRDLLAPLACAGLAAGAHGVMVEVHPDPDSALSDAAQQLSLPDFEQMLGAVAWGLADTASRCPTSRPHPAAELSNPRARGSRSTG